MADKKETVEGKMEEDNSNANQLGEKRGSENELSTEMSTTESENTDVLQDVPKLPVEDCSNKEGDVEDDRATIDTNSDTIETSPIHSVQSVASVDFEEPMTPMTDMSYKSQTGSGRVTPCSQSDQSMSMSSSEKNTPKKKKRKSTETIGRQIDFERQHGRSTVTGKNIKYPFRLGIQWKKGEKLEAMDYMHKWFPAKIREINPDTLSVLIHFDGWNQRFDEWVLMASDRIRPLIRHSERKERGKKLSKLDYKIGDQVYAKWTDCKMYPAKVTAIMANGSYEVIFYDGFKKQVQPINLRQMPGDLKQKTFEINPVPAEVIKKTKIRKELVGSNETVERTRRSSEASTSSGFSGHLQISTPEIQPEPIPSRRSSEKRRSAEKASGEKKSSRSKSKKVKMIPADLFKQSSIEGEDVLSQGLIQSEAAGTQTAYSDNLEVEIDDIKLENVSPADVGGYTDLSPQVPIATSTSTSSVPATSYGPQVLPPKAFVVESDHNRYKCHFEGCNKGFRKEHLLEYHIKYYHIDGSAAPPPTIQPFRKRRKTTSCTDSDSTPTGKRSMFKQRRHMSSESTLLQDIKTEVKEETDSISSPSTSHSMVPETGEISTQTTPIKGGDQSSIEETYHLIKDELGSKHHRSQSQDSNWTEDSSMTDLEGEDSLHPDELVNCICDFYEENGLMIQCEVCMCWQHAGCFGITERTLPKTYVCFVCENPPGVRESTKHIHEQDWLKSGEIPSFTYLQAPPVSEERRNIIKATNSLVTDLHSLNTVLHSLKLQLKILRTKDEQKLKMWRLDWDVMEPFEDQTDQQEETQDISQHVKEESSVGQEQEMSLNIEHQIDISLDIKQEVADVSESKGLDTPDVNTEDRITLDKESNDEIKSECDIEIKKEVVDGVEVNVGGKDTSSDIIEMDQTEAVIESNNEGKQGEGNTESTVKMETSADDTTTKSSDNSLQSLSFNKSETIVGDSGETAETEGGGLKEGIESSHDLNVSLELGKTDQGSDPTVHSEMEFEEANHSDSTESAVEDPLEMCEKNLLSHIFRVQEEINHRMDQIEEQVALLEAVEAAQESKEPPSSQALFSDMPQLKRCMKMMHGDLNKVKKMSVFH